MTRSIIPCTRCGLWPRLVPMFLALTLASQVASAQSTLPSRLRSRAAEIGPDLIEIRRLIHRHPELSGNEERTAALVAARLEKLGLEVTTGIGGYGVVGVLHGARPGPVVAYRADMDAVRSPVIGDAPYRSQVDGVNHVCGHDAHVAIALGIAEVLASVRDELPGIVKFIFQPAEETAQGAAAMIRDGALDKPRPRAIFAIHTFPAPVGKMVCPVGVGLSGYFPFELQLQGSGDVATTEESLVQTIQDMNTVPPITGPETYVTIMKEILRKDGAFADYTFVVGPNASTNEDGTRIVSGAIRAAHAETYERVRKGLEDAAKRVAAPGVDVQVRFLEGGLPDMHSDAELVQEAIAPIEAVLGKDSTIMMHASIPYFGEDFAYFQEHIPGAMFFLGVANPEKGLRAYNHFPDYDLDESALELGVATMSNVLMHHLTSP